MSDIQKVVRRQKVEQTNGTEVPQVDQAVVDQFVQLQDTKPKPFVKPTLEVFLRERYRLEPADYSPELLAIIKTMEEYVKVMSVGSNSTMTQHGEQVGRLNLSYNRALRSSDSVMLFDVVLHFFSFYEESTFRAELPYRGIHMYPFGTQEQVAFFQHITAVAQMLADIQTRNKRLRELDFRGAIGAVPKTFEKHRAGLTAFVEYYTNF